MPACRQDATRVVGDACYVPRWDKNKKSKCCIENCTEQAYACSKMASKEHVRAALETGELRCVREIQVPTPLCKRHYHIIYNILQPTQTNCPVCNISLKYTQS